MNFSLIKLINSWYFHWLLVRIFRGFYVLDILKKNFDLLNRHQKLVATSALVIPGVGSDFSICNLLFRIDRVANYVWESPATRI